VALKDGSDTIENNKNGDPRSSPTISIDISRGMVDRRATGGYQHILIRRVQPQAPPIVIAPTLGLGEANGKN
jgi:hypothetical protein